MTLNKFSSLLYKAARLTRDVNAVKRGRIGKRIVRRFAYRKAFGLLRKLLK